jgi:hypothetical protein
MNATKFNTLKWRISCCSIVLSCLLTLN